MEQMYLDLEQLNETVESIKGIKNELDKIDYMITAEELSGIEE